MPDASRATLDRDRADAADPVAAPEIPAATEAPERPPRPPLPPTLIRPPDDQADPQAELCRDVLDLVLELGIDLLTGPYQQPAAQERPVGAADPEVESAVSSPSAGAAGAAGAAGLDVRATTPFRLLRAARSAARAIARSGPGREGRDLLLLEVARCGVARPWRVAQGLGIGRSSVTGLVRSAERDGLLRVGRSGRDHRGVTVRLTREGMEAAQRAAEAWHAADERLLERFTSAEREELRRLLRKVVQVLRARPPSPPPR